MPDTTTETETTTMTRRRSARLQPVAAVLALAPVLTGCWNWPNDRQFTSAIVSSPVPLDGYQYSLARDMPMSRAFVELPQIAGPKIAVRETRFANGVEQFVVFESEATADGENRVEIRAVGGSSDSRVVDQHIKIRSTDSASIRKEMKDFVWGTSMRIVPTVETNAYGTFGYALGRRDQGFNCIYGWQTVKGERRERNFLGMFIPSATKMSIRVRLCRTDLNDRQLVDIMRGLRVTMAPDALDVEPEVVWRNDGYGVSSQASPNTATSGYITEGLQTGSGAVAPPQTTNIPAQPAMAAPRATAPTPRATTTRTTTRRASAPAVSRTREQTVRDPRDNRMTIFVDPREYVDVPLPGDIANAPVIRPQGASNTVSPVGGSQFGVPGAAATPSRIQTGARPGAGDLQSDAAREDRKDAISRLNGVATSRSGLWSGETAGVGGDSRDLFIAPEREGYRGIDLEEIQRQSRVEGSNVKHNLWLNDKARDDNTGMPLQRPCEVLRDAECASSNAELRRAPSILRDQ